MMVTYFHFVPLAEPCATTPISTSAASSICSSILQSVYKRLRAFERAIGGKKLARIEQEVPMREEEPAPVPTPTGGDGA
jgi:hypothetical protein